MTTKVIIKHGGPEHRDLMVHQIVVDADGNRMCQQSVRLEPGMETEAGYAHSGMSFEVCEVPRIEHTPAKEEEKAPAPTTTVVAAPAPAINTDTTVNN